MGLLLHWRGRGVGLFFLLLLLSSCKPSLPSGVMSEGKMERVLYDYHVAQSMAETSTYEEGRSTDERRYEMEEAVFRKHHITRADFDTSMVFYCSDIERLERIYKRVTERLERDAEALGAATAETDQYARYTAEGDTANVWVGRQVIAVHNHGDEHLQTWIITCDSTWLAGDDVLFRFVPQAFSRDILTSLYIDLVITYTNDSVRARTLQCTSRSNNELRIDDAEGWVAKSVTGHLYLPIERDPQRSVTYILNRLSLIRFHKSQEWRDRLNPVDSMAVEDSTDVDTLLAPQGRVIGALTDSTQHRRSPMEFREQQDVEQKINVVKEKPYQPQRRRRKPQQQQRRR